MYTPTAEAELGSSLITDEVEFSIVMPCLNEARTVGRCIEKAQGSLRKLAVSGEIIVADNGSDDDSRSIAKRMGARVIAVEPKGYGSALMGGITAARGTFIIMGDADDSYEFGDIGSFIAKLREGYDLVMGNRFAGGIEPYAMPLLHRYVGNPVLTAIGRLFFNSPCNDFHCGLRGFRRSSILGLDLRTTGMEFATEMVVKATLRGLRIAEVPIHLYRDGRDRPPHIRSWRDGWRHLRFLLLYSPRWLFLYPGFALMLVGTLAGLWLLPEPRTVGGVVFDVNTLVYAGLATVIGFQSIVFAVFTKVFAISEGLLPEDPRLSALFRYVTLEVGLAVGLALVALGVIGSLYAVGLWEAQSFGPLSPTASLRLVVPASTALALGLEVGLASFFLSILGLRRR
jgi:hypothetical protein